MGTNIGPEVKYTCNNDCQQMEEAMTDEMIPIEELESAGIIGPYHCTCLDDGGYYIGESGFCWFCEAVERIMEKRRENQHTCSPDS